MLENKKGSLSELESKEILEEAGIPTAEKALARSQEEAVKHAEDIKFPVVMKINSKDIQHKTDIEAVKEAHNEKEVRDRFEIIKENVKENRPDARTDGVLVEEKVTGIETIVGVNKDPDFGHVIMFGAGGIFVEVLKDVNFRVIPIERKDAVEMIESLKTKKLLEGIRNQEAADKEKIVDILMKISDFVERNPSLRELDINPLFVNENRAIAADALIKVNDET